MSQHWSLSGGGVANRTASRSPVLLAALAFVASAIGAAHWSTPAASGFQMQFRTAWMYLGEAAITDSTDYIRIEAKPYIRTFSDLQIRVRRHAVHLHRIRVHFADETTQDVPLDHRLPARGTSHTIGLENGNRSVLAIELWWEPLSPGEAALIQVYGRG